MSILKGKRPRPRVGLVGNFEEESVNALAKLFPTLQVKDSLAQLLKVMSPIETDLLIIGTDVELDSTAFFEHTHIICFSDSISFLPGPSDNSHIEIAGRSSTEEYLIAKQSLSFYNLLETDLSTRENAKGWPLIGFKINFRHSTSIPDNVQIKALQDGALLSDPHTTAPFATIFKRLDSDLDVAWLPNTFFDIVSWVPLICSEWAKDDQGRFPHFGDWTKNSEWMTEEEQLIKTQLNKLTSELEKLTIERKSKISKLDQNLLEASLRVNKAERRLITTQGDELLDEAAKSFEKLGFLVTKVDTELEKGERKKEDLRLRDPEIKNWEAIVEVRGHLKSSGQTADLNRLSKFARLFMTETGREPNKLIYVVNGQIEISNPAERQKPFSSAPEDVKEFGEQNGVIIWTVDLFGTLKKLTKTNSSEIRKTIRNSKGFWS